MSPRTQFPRILSDTAFAAVDYTTDRGVLTRYAVTLVAWHRGQWHTVRVYDNTHGQNDLHRHTLAEGKQPAETLHQGRRPRHSTRRSTRSSTATRR